MCRDYYDEQNKRCCACCKHNKEYFNKRTVKMDLCAFSGLLVVLALVISLMIFVWNHYIVPALI